jgi:hypothetical protein
MLKKVKYIGVHWLRNLIGASKWGLLLSIHNSGFIWKKNKGIYHQLIEESP